ncbi:SLAM family member 5-like [Nematolebias whitei]|uniref:SLAM family member 5-like n=1 Tax=Nematolebias whitei TaxID=451745 RepID=UPI001898EB25|nr:SLAM family member 5-like [Nematolebias whitei]
MAVMVLLLVVSLLDSAEGSERKFVKYKTDLLLDINQKTVSTSADFRWKFNQTVNVVKLNAGSEPNIPDTYKNRVKFFKKDYSLLLKNVQHEDSGVYAAIESESTDITLVEYNVIVQDPVSPVKITMDSSDAKNCNATVTCRTNDSKICRTFQCDSKTCSPVTNSIVSAPYSLLTVYVEHNNIICNHSNNVSSEQDNINLPCGTTPVPSAATIAGISAGLNMNPNAYDTHVRDALDFSPTSTYALVQLATRPAPKEESANKVQAETVYAQITRMPKPSSAAPTVVEQESGVNHERGHNPYNGRFKCEQGDKMKELEEEEEEEGVYSADRGAAMKVIPDITPQ